MCPEKKEKLIHQGGFTLLELMAVVILGILATIAIPSITGIIKKTNEDVCKANRLQVEKMYKVRLLQGDKQHSDLIFKNYLHEFDKELCPLGGDITYLDGEIKCSVNSDRQDEEDQDDGGVPYL